MARVTAAVPPTLTLPHKGGGEKDWCSLAPSPSMGEGWGGGDFKLAFTKGARSC